MAIYYKPQSPIQSGEDFIYPITTADQIMKSDNSRRLEQAGLIVADNSTKLGGKAPEYYIQPRNLLDNSDFRNPVNQRGQTTYNEEGYTIDRWKNEGTPDLNIVSGGIHLTCNSTLHLLIQYLSDEALNTLKGKAFTVAACTDDGSIYVSTGTFPGTGNLDSEQTILGSSGYKVNLYKTDTVRPMVRIFSTDQGSEVTLRWAALYEGSYTADTLPPYVPKGYAAELAACNSAPVDVGGGCGGGSLQAYPVGSIYMSVNSTSPASLFGGTWEQLQDRFLLAAGGTYSAGSTGGEATHTLTVNEMPNHNHSHPNNGHTFSWGDRSSTLRYNTGTMEAAGASGNELTSYQGPNNYTNYTGGNAAHNNLPPYLAVYMWKRVS